MKYTRQEWREELKKRFGDEVKNWAFKCPACGKITTVEEFMNIGADPNDAYQECIGRHTGKGAATADSKEGCDWAAYGLLGTLGKGDKVITESGKETEVFAMAPRKGMMINEDFEKAVSEMEAESKFKKERPNQSCNSSSVEYEPNTQEFMKSISV